jgi:hypothetical protein
MADTVSGVPFKNSVEEYLGTVTERLSGNGVESAVLTRAEILRRFR